MARVVAYVPDLLFGSSVLSSISAAGHEGELIGDSGSLARSLRGAAALVVDLTADSAERVELVGRLRPGDLPVLAFYAHVEADVRERAEQAGFDLVVPRSRMAREGPALLVRLLGLPGAA